jgi:acetyl esterase/lipase
MKILFWIAILGAGLLMPGANAKADHEVMTRNDILFAEHDGVRLLGDFYAPKGVEKAPVLVAVHGGGWQVGNRKFYTNWGRYLAKNGFAVFAIEYRLMKPDVKAYPGAVYDTKAAVQYIRANADELGIDPERSGTVGDSAGAHGRGASVFQRIPVRCPCLGTRQGQSGGRLLRCLRHAGAMGARPAGAPTG